MSSCNWKQSESIDRIAPAIIALQSEGLFVIENRDNNQTRSKYADLTTIWIAIQGMLAKHQLSVLQPLGRIRSENGKFVLALETIVLHSSGQWISAESEILVPTNDKLSVAWWAGSAQTYGRRYALVSMLGIITGEDDDGQALQRGIERPPVPKVKQSQFLPKVDGEWAVYANEGWRGYRLDDGMEMGQLDNVGLSKLVRTSDAEGTNVAVVKGYLWDVLGTRLDILGEPLEQALMERGFDGFVVPDEWEIADFRKAAAVLHSNKKPADASKD